jgi:Leucine-rich repeat (LRR) protein
MWASAAFLVLTGLACSAPFLFGSARDTYPFDNGDECRPCACSGDAVLESCAIPASLRVRNLYIDGKGIRSIAPNAFRGLSFLKVLDMSHNNISALPAGSFDGLDNLKLLDLSANVIGTLEAGVFDAVPTLLTLLLRDNRLVALRAGAFAGLHNLRNLFSMVLAS